MHGAVDADGGNGRHQRRDRHHDRTDQAGTEPGHEHAGPHHFPANGGHCVPWPHCLLQGKVMSKPQRQRKRKNGTVKKLLVDRFLDHCCFGLLLANNQWLFQEDETKVHS